MGGFYVRSIRLAAVGYLTATDEQALRVPCWQQRPLNRTRGARLLLCWWNRFMRTSSTVSQFIAAWLLLPAVEVCSRATSIYTFSKQTSSGAPWSRLMRDPSSTVVFASKVLRPMPRTLSLERFDVPVATNIALRVDKAATIDVCMYVPYLQQYHRNAPQTSVLQCTLVLKLSTQSTT